MTNQKALLSSASNDWGTPSWLCGEIRYILGRICLDPASSERHNKRIQATRIYSIENGQDGLHEPWNAEALFLNPPYGREGPKWIHRWISEYRKGTFESGLLLVGANTAQKWFQPLWDFPLCFFSPRLQFVGLDDQVRNGNTRAHVMVLATQRADARARFNRLKKYGRVIG